MRFRSADLWEYVKDHSYKLKGKPQWNRTFIDTDRTKEQRRRDKEKGEALQAEADKNNLERTPREKNEIEWKVIGPRSDRRLVKKKKMQH